MVQNNSIQKDIFSSFPQYDWRNNTSGANSGLKQPHTIALQAVEVKDNLEISEDNKKTMSKKGKILFGSGLASTILTAGVLGILFGKGLHGSFLSKFSKLSERLTKEIQFQTKKNAPKNVVSKASHYAKKGTKKTIDAMQASSNFATLKDWSADRLYRTNRFTAKFADDTTSLFKRIVDRTLGKKYDKVGVKVQDLTSLLKHYNLDDLNALSAKDKAQKITIKGKEYTLEQVLELLKSQNQLLEGNFDKNFSLGARKLRDKERMDLLSDLPKDIKKRFFGSKKDLFRPENYKTYATEDLSKEAQQILREEILTARKKVTNNIPTIHDGIKTSLNKFSQSTRVDDDLSQLAVQDLKILFEDFKKCSGANEEQARQKISQKISSIIDMLMDTTAKNPIYTEAEQQEMYKHLDAIKETVTSTGIGSKGALEEIMTILNALNQTKLQSTGQKIISDKSYKEFSKLSSKISKGLESATELEMGEYFLKQAELKVGSAPNDVLSVLFPVGVGAYSIAKGDDKDEKISATLTTCIPLVGTFATFVYGTVKMFSGAKNMAFSFLSGIALSKLGNYCDKLYKRYRDSGSVVNVVKEEYDNFVTELTPSASQPIKEKKEAKK